MTLTHASILGAREHFAQIERDCIAGVLSGAVRVTDRTMYFTDCQRREAAALAGEYDHTFTFRQMAHFIQTGECVPLLGGAP